MAMAMQTVRFPVAHRIFRQLIDTASAQNKESTEVINHQADSYPFLNLYPKPDGCFSTRSSG